MGGLYYPCDEDIPGPCYLDAAEMTLSGTTSQSSGNPNIIDYVIHLDPIPLQARIVCAYLIYNYVPQPPPPMDVFTCTDNRGLPTGLNLWGKYWNKNGIRALNAALASPNKRLDVRATLTFSNPSNQALLSVPFFKIWWCPPEA